MRWLVQDGVVVVTSSKSGNPAHLTEDLELFDFQLSEQEMAALGRVGTRCWETDAGEKSV